MLAPSLVTSATSKETIDKLRNLSATFGLPDQLVSDNGSVFTSEEFTEFVKKNGLSHVKVAPYHPQSNGLVERAIQTMKANVLRQTEGSLETKLARFLFAYRTTPQSTTTVNPAELMFGRKIKTRLDMLHPDLRSKVISHQHRQKDDHDRHHSQFRAFREGKKVYVRNYRSGPNWLEGKIIQVLGPVSYTVQMSDGKLLKRHIDQLRSSSVQPQYNLHLNRLTKMYLKTNLQTFKYL